MEKENIDFFVNKMEEEGFHVVRFKGTPESAVYVGFDLYKDRAYIDSVVISDSIKDDITDYHFVKFIGACTTIAIYKSRERGAKR